MRQSFDPYHKWLGIAPKDQPPNHYRLLGIELYENDLDVIANAADRQMAHVRGFQAGRHDDLAQQLLNEISAARLCLLSEARKSDYDQSLIAKRATQAAVAKTAKGERWSEPIPAADEGFLCPHCQEVIGYDAALPGHTINCPTCRQLFAFPSQQVSRDDSMSSDAVGNPAAGTKKEVDETPHAPIIPGNYALECPANRIGAKRTPISTVFKLLIGAATIAWLAAMPTIGILAFQREREKMMAFELEPGVYLVHNEAMPESAIVRKAIGTAIADGLLLPTVVYAVAIVLLSAVHSAAEGPMSRLGSKPKAARAGRAR